MSMYDVVSILVPVFYPPLLFLIYLMFTTYGLDERLDIFKVFESIAIVVLLVGVTALGIMYVTLSVTLVLIAYVIFKMKIRSKR